MINHTVTIELPDVLYQKFAARSRQTKRSLAEELLTAFAVDLPMLPLPDAAHTKVYDEVLNFLASGPTPAEILQFQLSTEARQRASLLFQQDRAQGITDAESQALDFYVALGDFLGILRAKAQLQLQNSASS